MVQSSQRTCSDFTYCIQSPNNHEVMVFTVNTDGSRIEGYVDALWKDSLKWRDHVQKISLLLPAYVEVYFYHCPIGFELSPDYSCVCAKALNNSVSGCSIDLLQIERKGSYWIGVKSKDHNNSSTSFLIHKHCPFDNCKKGAFLFSFNKTDAQCNRHRFGILCGACEPGYSLILGGTECRHCTNIYLLLLIGFTVAGVGLVIFLSLTDTTVAKGTLVDFFFMPTSSWTTRLPFSPHRLPTAFSLSS